MLQSFDRSRAQTSQSSLGVNLNTLPLIELHTHAEGGTLTPQTLNGLAKANGMEPPRHLYGSGNRITYKPHDFFDFLKAYDEATAFILTKADIEKVIYKYLKKCHFEGAMYVELTCSPDHVKRFRKKYEHVVQELESGTSTHTQASEQEQSTNLSYADFVEAIARAIDRARKDFGIEGRILMVLLRHNGEEAAQQAVDEILAYRHPYVVGINLAGDETNFPPALFAKPYAKAKKHGLKLTAHVGEHAGPEKIIEAVNVLQLDRVGHGVTAIQSEKTMAFLRERNIALELCPSSNVEFNIFPSLSAHPLRAFFDAKIKFTINSDDNGFIGSSLGDEHRKAQETFKLTDDDMQLISQYGIESGFCDDLLKSQLFAHLALYRAYQQLKASLEPLRKNDVYKTLEAYARLPNEDALRQLEECLQRTCLDRDDFTSLQTQMRALSLNHFDFQAKRKAQHDACEQALAEFKLAHLQVQNESKRVAVK
ncbi:MAG: adenosine deaminase [Proteobacteria bacterium]|nr:adenosine deaminase [Pseudomonadota bacterium]